MFDLFVIVSFLYNKYLDVDECEKQIDQMDEKMEDMVDRLQEYLKKEKMDLLDAGTMFDEDGYVKKRTYVTE